MVTRVWLKQPFSYYSDIITSLQLAMKPQVPVILVHSNNAICCACHYTLLVGKKLCRVTNLNYQTSQHTGMIYRDSDNRDHRDCYHVASDKKYNDCGETHLGGGDTSGFVVPSAAINPICMHAQSVKF